MSQPQVSVALGKLRELFSDAVFVRTTNGMQPTPRAAVLVKSAREVLTRSAGDFFRPPLVLRPASRCPGGQPRGCSPHPVRH
jgi:hypothetical protein